MREQKVVNGASNKGANIVGPGGGVGLCRETHNAPKTGSEGR